MTWGLAQAGNRTSKTARRSQWWDSKPEWSADASGGENQHDWQLFCSNRPNEKPPNETLQTFIRSVFRAKRFAVRIPNGKVQHPKHGSIVIKTRVPVGSPHDSDPKRPKITRNTANIYSERFSAQTLPDPYQTLTRSLPHPDQILTDPDQIPTKSRPDLNQIRPDRAQFLTRSSSDLDQISTRSRPHPSHVPKHCKHFSLIWD